MILTLNSPYLSITELEPTDLPRLTVLTGENGSGKTHLLEGIYKKRIALAGLTLKGYARSEAVTSYYDFNTIAPNEARPFNPQGLAEDAWKHVKWATNGANAEALEKSKKLLLDKGLELDTDDIICIDQLSVEDISELCSLSENCVDTPENIHSELRSVLRKCREFNYGFNKSEKAAGVREFFSAYLKNTPLYYPLTEHEFKAIFPHTLSEGGLFQQNLSEIFASYLYNSDRNDYKTYLNERYGQKHDVLSEEDFLKVYSQPPWEMVNRLLDKLGTGFRVTFPTIENITSPFSAELIKMEGGTTIKFDNLSSGEKVIMSLALCMYNVNNLKQPLTPPDVLLLDEIDATLNPRMVKLMLDTIQEDLIEEHGINVILATHKPTTVALAPADAIFVMNSGVRKRIEKASKDKALSALTAGIPTLSIDYENRRQVFVENETDATLYSQLALKLKSDLQRGASVNFISTGGKGKKGTSDNEGCDRVMKVVESLRDAGARNIYGLVDWDGDDNRPSNDHLHVLAKGKRYSIENCLLDPLLVGALLVHDRHETNDKLGLPEGTNSNNLDDLCDEHLQFLVDFVSDRLYEHTSSEGLEALHGQIGEIKDGAQQVICKYKGGQELKIPKWYLKIKGHDLEDGLKGFSKKTDSGAKSTKILGAFPKLSTHNNPGKLMEVIVSRVIDNHPAFIPIELIEAITHFQK